MSKFITLEGVEGAGKSTLRSKLAELLREQGEQVVVTREPGATALGRSLRSLLLNPENKNLDPTAELLLFAADRAQHVVEVIKPALARGAFVICDRFIHSTLAYQGYGRGLDLQHLRRLNALVTSGVSPDLVILLDLDPELGLKRARERTEKSTISFNIKTLTTADGIQLDAQDRFEEQSLDFHRAVRRGFLELASDPANRMRIVDASAGPEHVLTNVLSIINHEFPRRKT